MRTDYSSGDGWDYGRTIVIRYPCAVKSITIPINIERELRRRANMEANLGPFQEIDTTGSED